MAPLAAVGVEPGRVPGKACTATTLLVASSLPKLEPRGLEPTKKRELPNPSSRGA